MDPVTEADVGQSVVETVVSIMPQVVPTTGSEVEQTEIPAIAVQQLIQAQATAAATTSVDSVTEADEGQSVIETVVSIMPQVAPITGSKVGGAAKLIFDNYLPNWIWLVVDIYRDLKRWGKYPLLFIDTEVNSCLSIHLNRETIQHKKRDLS